MRPWWKQPPGTPGGCLAYNMDGDVAAGISIFHLLYSGGNVFTISIPIGIIESYKGDAAMDNRDMLMQVALDLFYSKGYDAVGVQEIVDKSGVTKPTLYYYFGSKKGLLESLLDKGYRNIEESLAGACAHRDSLSDTLYHVARSFFDYTASNRKFYLLMLSLFYSARENEAFQTVYPYIQRYYQRIVQIFEDAAPQLGNMRGRQRQFAVGFTGVLNHHIMMAAEYAAPDGIIEITNEATYEIVHQFMYGIFS